MKNLILLIWYLLPLCLFSQTKGVVPIPNSQFPITGTTRAVVVGISNYQDKDIPDLQFADADAIAFANWLKSPAGGNVPADNIQLLTNEKATNGAIIVTLYALINEGEEGDRVVIYFSGHGDVDCKIISQDGYLLAYDTPASLYMGGAVELGNLQKIVSTLSLSKKANVLIIADACHSGKLAGSTINGAQLTGANLAKQFAGESKILSCQPNEYSMEGEQWGGGRGVFTYFLVKGLTGLADKNNDGSVSLYEIDRYLSDAVPPETAPQLQTPSTVGDRNAAIARVDASSFDRLRKEEEQIASLKKINPKGLEDEVLAKADSATRQQYFALKNAIAAGELLESTTGGRSAWELFQLLSANTQLEPLHRLMRRNFAVALLDEVQQALNALLTDDPYEVNQWRWNPKKYARYPELVQRAIEVLGKEHPLYHSLEAKRLFFEAYGITRYSYGSSGAQGPDSLKQLAWVRLYQALKHETLAPYVYYLLGNTYLGTYREDSLMYYYEKAMELSPAWTLPHLELAWDYLDTYFNFEEVGNHLHRALALRPNSYQSLEMLAWWHQRYNRIDSVEAICHRMRSLRPDLLNDYATLACTELICTRNYERAELYCRQYLAHDSGQYLLLMDILFKSKQFEKGFQELVSAPANAKSAPNEAGYLGPLANHFLNIHDWRRADSLWRSVVQNTPSRGDRAIFLAILGKIQVHLGQLDSAERLLQSAFEMVKIPAPAHSISLPWLGVIAQKRGETEKAESYFQKASRLPPELWTWQGLEYGAELFALYGNFLAGQNRFPEAEEKYRKSIEIDSGNYLGYYAMARFQARQGNSTAALDNLEKALDRYYPIPQPILEEPLFKKIRKTKRFKALMEKHFPSSWKER